MFGVSYPIYPQHVPGGGGSPWVGVAIAVVVVVAYAIYAWVVSRRFKRQHAVSVTPAAPAAPVRHRELAGKAA